MFNIKDIDTWKVLLGLFNIRMFPNIETQYLLGGGRGNFGLDVHPQGDNNEFNSVAWSSNIKNYITISNTQISIYNWLKPSVEQVNINDVVSNIDRFYQYIMSQTYTTGNDVVPVVLELFRKMRNLSREKDSSEEALNLLYLLLLSLNEDIDHLDYNKWQIKKTSLPYQFDYFIDEIKSGIKDMTPNLNLILRHCSGPIFQEAHRIVDTFFPERDLFGDVSSKIDTYAELYSSAHYTPTFLARSIVEQAIKRMDLKKDVISVFDPACGSSEFLLEILKQLSDNKYQGRVFITGWDSSRNAIQTSKFLLNYEKVTHWNDRLVINLEVVDDSLIKNWDFEYDLILMNPPFLSWELLTKGQREIVSSVFNNDITKPNEAVAFLQKAIDSMKSGSIIGCIMPTQFFNSSNYGIIRSQMKDSLTTLVAGKLGNYIFENVLTDVSMYIGYKPTQYESTKLIWCKNEAGVAQDALCALRKVDAGNLRELLTEKFSIYIPSSYPDGGNSWKIVSKQDLILKEKLQRNLSIGKLKTINEIFSIKQGIRTGYNKLFIITKEQYDDLTEIEKSFYRKSVDNGTINDARLLIGNYIWYPYDLNGLSIQSEDDLSKLAPWTYTRLYPHKDRLIARASLSNKQIWWSLSRHREWLLKHNPRIVSTEFGNSHSFSLDMFGEYAIERGLAWIPRKVFTEEDYFFYLAFFNSSFFNKLLSIYSRELAGTNVYDLGAKFSNHIPAPCVYDKWLRKTNLYSQLVALGKLIMEDGYSYYITKIDSLLFDLID